MSDRDDLLEVMLMTMLDLIDRPSPAARLLKLGVDGLGDLAEQLNGSPVPGVRMTERQFLDWSLNHFKAEWVDGEVILMAPANNVHDDMEVWLLSLVQHVVEDSEFGFTRRDMFIRLPRNRRLRVPDLMVIAADRLNIIKPTLIDGAPDLVIEIESPDSRNRDRRDKFSEYEKAGVREYWIIDPLLQTIDLYLLRGKKLPVDGRYLSTVLSGFYLRAAWLFESPRPKVSQVLKEFATFKRSGARKRK